MLRHKGQKPYACESQNCNATFKTKAALKRHLMLKHAPKGEKLFKCHLCPSKFSCEPYLKNHIARHTQEKPYLCDFPGCTAAFKFKYYLKTHQERHVAQKVHQCTMEGCGHMFKTLHEMQNHLKSHSTEKPHACNMCEATFKAKVNKKYNQISWKAIVLFPL